MTRESFVVLPEAGSSQPLRLEAAVIDSTRSTPRLIRTQCHRPRYAEHDCWACPYPLLTAAGRKKEGATRIAVADVSLARRRAPVRSHSLPCTENSKTLLEGCQIRHCAYVDRLNHLFAFTDTSIRSLYAVACGPPQSAPASASTFPFRHVFAPWMRLNETIVACRH